ncbi:hypothetical protein ACOMHN_063353 [Nucella lapillus]
MPPMRTARRLKLQEMIALRAQFQREGIPELGRADLDTGAASPWHSPLSGSDYRLQLAPLKSSLQPVFAFVRFDSSSLRAFSHSMGDIIVHDLRAFYHTTEIGAL